jgi:hypothetical protein
VIFEGASPVKVPHDKPAKVSSTTECSTPQLSVWMEDTSRPLKSPAFSEGGIKVNTRKRVSINGPTGLDSPFLAGEFSTAEVDEDRHHRVSMLMSNTAFQSSFDRVDDRGEFREFDETEAAPGFVWRDFAEEEQPQRVQVFRIVDDAKSPKPVTGVRGR